ncbi:type IV pilus biogenesis/stability protein PilW [Thalassotalea fusca]
MDTNSFKPVAIAAILFAATGCVTQSYENDNSTPVIQNEATNNEIAMTRISLGLGYLKMGNTTQAKLNLEKAKRFAPNLVQVYTAFAHYYDTVSETELAIASYEKALSLKNDDADTLNNYGVFLCKQENYQEAERQFLKAIAVPSYLLVSQSYQNLALCQLKAHKFEKAEQYLVKAIQHSPSSATALYQMARLQYIKGDYEQAKLYFKRYEKATRRFSAEGLTLGYKIHQKQFDKKTAKNYATMMVKMFPASFQAKQYLLNELEEIEADEVAKIYRATLHDAKDKKKRVVRLAPKTNSEPLPAERSESQRQLDKPKSAETITAKKNIEMKQSSQANASDNIVKVPMHTVEKGQSLFAISVMYNIQMKTLEKWNHISRNDVLSIGDIIYLADPNQSAATQE